MARKISMAAIEAALRSPKTPAGLKKGLMKKYGHLLGGSKVPMEALATTMRPNHPKGPKYLIVGRYRHQPQSPWVQYDGYDERQMATDELRSWRNEKPNNIFKVVLAKSFYPYSNPTKKMRPNPKKRKASGMWYIGIDKNDYRDLFQDDETPTKGRYPLLMRVYGPFRTRDQILMSASNLLYDSSKLGDDMHYFQNHSPKFWYVATNGTITEIGRVSPQKAELLGEEIAVFGPFHTKEEARKFVRKNGRKLKNVGRWYEKSVSSRACC